MRTSKHRGKHYIARNAEKSDYLHAVVSSSLQMPNDETSSSRFCTLLCPFKRLPPTTLRASQTRSRSSLLGKGIVFETKVSPRPSLLDVHTHCFPSSR